MFRKQNTFQQSSLEQIDHNSNKYLNSNIHKKNTQDIFHYNNNIINRNNGLVHQPNMIKKRNQINQQYEYKLQDSQFLSKVAQDNYSEFQSSVYNDQLQSNRDKMSKNQRISRVYINQTYRKNGIFQKSKDIKYVERNNPRQVGKENVNLVNKCGQFRQPAKSQCNLNLNNLTPIHNNNYISNQSISSIASSHHDDTLIQKLQEQRLFLKNKLIQTHQKLLKQVEISKQLQDNFFILKKKYQEQQKKLQEQNKKYVKNQQQIRKLKVQNLQINEKINMQKDKYNTTKQRKLKQENQQLKNANTAYIQKNQELKQKNQTLKLDLQSMRQKVLTMITQKQNFEDQIEQLQNQLLLNKQKLSLIQQKYTKKQKQFTQKQELCQIWRKKYQKVQEQYKKIQQSYYKNQNQLKQTKVLSIDLQTVLKQQKQKNAQMLNEIINVQMQNKQLKTKLQISQSQKREFKNKLIQTQQDKITKQQKFQIQQQYEKLLNQYNNCLSLLKQKDKQILNIKNQYFEKEIERQNKEKEKQKSIKSNSVINANNNVKMFVNKLQEDNQNLINGKRNQQFKYNQNLRQKSKSPMAKNSQIQSPKTFNYNHFIKPSLSLKNIDTNQKHNDTNLNQLQQIHFNEASYQDSLQCYKLNKVPMDSSKANIQKKIISQALSQLQPNKNKSFKSNPIERKSPQNNNNNILIAENEEDQQEQVKNLRSYKQKKQQYISLLSQVGDKQTQIYNLNIEKNKILDQLDRIQNIKVKNKDLIAKRRQLQAMLLANDNQINQIKEDLKKLRVAII